MGSSRVVEVSRRGWIVGAALAGVFLAVAAGLIAWGGTPARVAFDQNLFHLKVIDAFRAQWPWFDFHDYPSATTPAYHVALATVAKFVSGDVRVLRLAGAAFTVLLLGTLGAALGTRAGGTGMDRGRLGVAIAAGLAVMASPYVMASGAWILPDNAAWWGVLLVLLVSLSGRVDGKMLALGSLALTGLVLVRQNQAWTLAPLFAAAWLGPARSDTATEPAAQDEGLFTLAEIRGLWTDVPTRLRRVGWACVAAILPLATLAHFVHLWHGLTTPTFQHDLTLTMPDGTTATQPAVQGINAATPAYMLALLGVYGVFFAPLLARPLAMVARRRPGVLVAALAVAAGLAAGPATTFDKAAGRWTGLWNIAARLPTLGGHTSALIFGLALVGMAVVMAMLQGLGRRDRWVMVVTLATFVATQSVNHECWQRYMEPVLLIIFALAGVRLAERQPARGRWEEALRVAGPATLAGVLAVLFWGTIRGG